MNNVLHKPQITHNPDLTDRFIAGDGASFPPGSPSNYAFKAAGLYLLGGAGDGRHLYLCPPIEVLGHDTQGRVLVRAGLYPETAAVAIARRALPHTVRLRLAQIGCLPPAGAARLKALASYFENVALPTGQLWTRVGGAA